MTDDEGSAALIALDEALKQALAVASPDEVMRRVALVIPGMRSEFEPEALDEERRLALMDELAAEMEAMYGPVPEELILEAMREWPDYEEE